MTEPIVDIDGEEGAPWIRIEALALLRLLAQLPECSTFEGPLELSLVLTNDAAIQELNARWRAVDSPTDVLSFPLEEGPRLGDVVISLETAESRTRGSEWLLEDEVLFLLIHGVLHLLGHDHMEEQERATMEAQEQALWTAMGRPGTLRTAGATTAS